MDNISGLDFNDAPDAKEIDLPYSYEDIRERVLARLPEILDYLFPNGVVKGKQFFIGDIHGNPGKSLVVELSGPKAGLWIDFASNDSGDIFWLWANDKNLDTRRDFPKVLKSLCEWLSLTPPVKTKTKKKQPPMDELGPHSAKWNYYDANENLIACVYRHDTEKGKVFRPWDVKAGKYKAPEPRPLYHLPQINNSEHVILVEGEKCADALTEAGQVATTAMNGANAPIDKTDWSPLKDKHVLIWPDNDEPGKEYAEKAAQAIANAGAKQVEIMYIPDAKPSKWDAADAVEEGIDINEFLTVAPKFSLTDKKKIESFTLGELLNDDSPIPDDLIEPRVLTPGGMLVLGGAAKVGKSDFVLSWLVNLAAGDPFLGMNPTKRLNIFYLQAEVGYHYLRERLQQMELPQTTVWRASENLHITPQLKMVLDDEGMKQAIQAMKKASEKEPIDVIVIDPLRNVFYGGDDGANENDNHAMLYFLQKRVEKLRDAVNPESGIIMIHHTRKLNSRQFMDDPFQSFSGASSLRGYYTSGMLLYRPEDNKPERLLKFELRNGAPIYDKLIKKMGGQWTELDQESQRLVNQKMGEKLDAERRRKQDQILQLIFDEAAEGRVYTINQFAEKFEGTAGLGGHRTIVERVNVAATKGEIKFFKKPEKYHLPKLSRSKYGYICVEEMIVPGVKEVMDLDTGAVKQTQFIVKPTHYKCAENGAVLPVENPDIWVYQDEQNSVKKSKLQTA